MCSPPPSAHKLAALGGFCSLSSELAASEAPPAPPRPTLRGAWSVEALHGTLPPPCLVGSAVQVSPRVASIPENQSLPFQFDSVRSGYFATTLGKGVGAAAAAAAYGEEGKRLRRSWTGGRHSARRLGSVKRGEGRAGGSGTPSGLGASLLSATRSHSAPSLPGLPSPQRLSGGPSRPAPPRPDPRRAVGHYHDLPALRRCPPHYTL